MIHAQYWNVYCVSDVSYFHFTPFCAGMTATYVYDVRGSWAAGFALFPARINTLLASLRRSRYGEKPYYKRVCRYRDFEVEITSLSQ
jgi:hypothetical protein